MTSEILTIEPEQGEEGLAIPPDQNKLMLAEMLSVGKSTKEIAANLDRSEAWVRKWKKDPGVQGLVMQLHNEAVETAKSIIVSGTQKAASTLVDLMDTGPASIRLAAAKDILDRLGMKAPDKKQIEATVNVTSGLSREERMARIIEKADRLGVSVPASLRGQVVPVDVTEVSDE